MLTLATDYKGLKDRLDQIGLGEDHPEGPKVSDALIAILLTLESFDLSEDSAKTILNLISSEGRRQLKSTPTFGDDSWRDFDYGNVSVGSYVRVKKDAYDSETGRKHNGLVGILGGVRGYSADIRYIGLATGNSMKHPLEKLESLLVV